MLTNNNRLETYRVKDRFVLSNHAKERMATGGLHIDGLGDR